MAQVFPHLHIVLLADDFGEGLWPLARRQAPACLVPAGEGADSLLSAAVARTRPFSGYPVHVVTTKALADSLYDELVTFAGLKPADIDMIVVPLEQGSAFSVALACSCIRRQDPDAVVMVLAANQKLELDDRWPNLVFCAYQVALRDRIVLFGAQQERRCAGVSYIRCGGQFENVEGTYEVRLFATDARPAAAERAIRDGALWYTDMFMGRAASILGAYAHAEDDEGGTGGVGRIAETTAFLALLQRSAWYTDDARSLIAVLPNLTVEKAALEPSRRLVALPVTAQVTVISSLADLDNATPADDEGNRAAGKAVTLDTSNTTVLSQGTGRLVCTYGVEGLAIVDTADTLLVARKTALRDMGPLFEALGKAGAPQLDSSVRRPFPWGVATLLAHGPKSATFQLDVRAGAVLDTLCLADAYGCFVPDVEDGAEGARQDAHVPVREQYAVACGRVGIRDAGTDKDPLPMEAGDAFEVDEQGPLAIVCDGQEPAVLILTVVACQDSACPDAG